MKKNLVITGGTKGIGKAIILHFAKYDYNIYFCARNEFEISALQESLQSQYPTQEFKGYIVDVANKEEIIKWSDVLKKDVRLIDVLVNNAGSFQPGNVIDEPDGQLERMLDVNLLSAYTLTRSLLPLIKLSERAYIFNLCSIASLAAYQGGGSYSISKYALLGFSDNLRLELMPHNIAVTAVLPGATMSDSWSGSGVSPDRIMEASDIASMIYVTTTLSYQTVTEKIILRPQLGDL